MNWTPVSSALGFADELTMWKKYYEVDKMAIAEIASRLGVSHNAVRDRLVACGIELRKRGGPNHQKLEMTDEIRARCEAEGTKSVADSLGLSYTTLHKQLKKKDPQDVPTPNPESPGQADSPVRPEPQGD